MPLETQLKDDLKTAMKAREKVRLGTIRMLLADLSNQQIALGRPLEEAEELALLAGQAKRRREAMAAFEEGGRDELAANEAAELAIVETYLPAQLTPDEVRAKIAAIVDETGASSKADIGRVMGRLMPQIKGRFPGGEVKALVDEALA